MVPVIIGLGKYFKIKPLFWALSLGACFGGNTTLIGAAANVVAIAILERRGYHIHFGEFMKYGMVVTMCTVVISTLYIIIRFGGVV